MTLDRRIALAAIKYFLRYRTVHAEAARRELFRLCKEAIAPQRYEKPEDRREAA